MILLTDTFRLVPRRTLVEPWLDDETLVTFWWGWRDRLWKPGYLLIKRPGKFWLIFKINKPEQGGRVHQSTVKKWAFDDTTRRLGKRRLPSFAAVEMVLRHLYD